ncbi:transmembrane protein 53-like isoform X2 [Ascaphus truei]|uniref:transmembrane protein 53-like isoform X2 n=1 Tax=Ascaphus truei TaxID=8439 RepID=UPI003F59E005
MQIIAMSRAALRSCSSSRPRCARPRRASHAPTVCTALYKRENKQDRTPGKQIPDRRAYTLSGMLGELQRQQMCQAQAPTAPHPLPKGKQYSSSVFLYTDPSFPGSSQGASRPLLLLLPWLGSNRRSYRKYIQLYFQLGFDVLVAESSLSHFLWPRRGLDYAGQLLDILMGEDLSSRHLYVHAFSIGGYTFAQMLVWASNGQQEHREALGRIRGQVFDSLVVGSMEKMASGVASMVSPPLLQQLVLRGTLLYFALLKAQTADYYEKGIRVFWDTPLTCPALFFYCMDDPLSDPTAVGQLLTDWERRGIRVQGKRWDSSVHSGHLHRHPQEYTDTLNCFIRGLQPNSPKCKL